MPDGFTPDSTAQDIAISLALNAADELTAFTDYHAANGSTFLCWQAAFRTWLRNAAKFSRKPAATTANRQTETAHMRQEREVAQGLAPNVARIKPVTPFDFVEMEKSNVALINRN